MVKFLKEDERSELLSRHKHERDKRVADRIKVVLLCDDGYNSLEIAKVLFIDSSTVRRHLDDYNEEKRLKPDHKGSKPMLSEDESLKLVAHLEANLYTKIKEIKYYIYKTYNKRLSITAIYSWLKRHGFTYKKPKLTPKAPDLIAQKEFIKKYDQLLNQAALEDEIVLFGDAVHPSQITRPSYGWVRKGKDKLLKIKSGRKRVNIMGAINLENMNFIYQDFETISATKMVEFLKKLDAKLPKNKKIHLILDQAGYCTAKEVKDYIKESRIKIHYLPSRSPNLNAIERLWKVMHEYVSNNKIYDTFRQFKTSLFNFFDNILPSITDRLLDTVTDNFRISQCVD